MRHLPKVLGLSLLIGCAEVRAPDRFATADGGFADSIALLSKVESSREPANDWISFATEARALAIGSLEGVCPLRPTDAGDCEGPDSVDEWSINSSAGGEHLLEIVWSPDVCSPTSANCSDLDLFLVDMNGGIVAESTDGLATESLCAMLDAGTRYFLRLVAVDTHGSVQNYTLRAERLPCD
jgi:hypothetical protein